MLTSGPTLGPLGRNGRVEIDAHEIDLPDPSGNKRISKAQAVNGPHVTGLSRCYCFGSHITALELMLLSVTWEKGAVALEQIFTWWEAGPGPSQSSHP